MSYYDRYKEFEELKGKTITAIVNYKHGDGDMLYIRTDDDKTYLMCHEQDCCESVTLEDVCGDFYDLYDTPILLAEETHNTGDIEYGDHFTATFYKLSTIKGSITMRWYGTSNGYYSERVSFIECDKLEDDAKLAIENSIITRLAKI